MIAHLREREKNLEPFGWSQQDAEWVAMVCLHSGVFTRLQYMDYFNTYHLRAARFVQNLVNLKLAVDEDIPVSTTRNRTRACRITHKSIYQELGIPNVRHRRIADPAVYLRRLLSLDYVIDHPGLEWLPTETEKVWFCKHLDIGKDRLPRRLYTGAAGYLTRYFPLKLPIAAGRTVTFVYVDPGNDTIAELRHWGQSHEHVWAGIRKHGMQVHVAAIALHSRAGNRARSVLNGWARDREGIKAGSDREAGITEGTGRGFQGHRHLQLRDFRALRGPAKNRSALPGTQGHAGKTVALQHSDRHVRDMALRTDLSRWCEPL